MPIPVLSETAQHAESSVIRTAQELFAQRSDKDEVSPVNLAIGNITRPIHPAMFARLQEQDSGIVPYTPTAGTPDARAAILNVIEASGCNVQGLYAHVTAGGTGAMELMIRACCETGKPLMLIEPFYTNYEELARKLGIPKTSVSRTLTADGIFSQIPLDTLEQQISSTGANALVVIPYDNPSGQFLPQSLLTEIAKICVSKNIWLVSDEAYRGLVYTDEQPSSIYRITEKEVPGIQGRRIGIESVSKLFNACGLRMGALVTDNKQLHEQAVKLATPELCASTLGQHALSALGTQSSEQITQWINNLREYYRSLLQGTVQAFRNKMPNLVVSNPDASIYFAIDFRNIADDFDAKKFVIFCATRGKVDSVLVDGKPGTLFLAPMEGFYSNPDNGKTQMRVAAVGTSETMLLAPQLCAKLFEQYKSSS